MYIYGKQKRQTSVRFLHTENEKRKFVFLGRQTINGNRRLLQQTWPSRYSMAKTVGKNVAVT